MPNVPCSPAPTLRCRRLLAFLFAALLLTAAPGHAAPDATIQLERTIMPDAAPSSFAIAFPNGVNLCYDPVRGGVNYVWSGGFADFSPARPGMGKITNPVHLLGPIVYREDGATPLRRNHPTRVAQVEFKGYRLRGDAVEFLYTIDNVLVREEVRARPQGDGITRRFRIDPADGDARWWYVPEQRDGGALAAPAGQPDANGFRFEGDAARDFTLEITFRRNAS